MDVERTDPADRSWKFLPGLLLIGQKAAQLVFVFLAAAILLFAAVRSLPGADDPVSLRMKNPDPARAAEMRASLGLDAPLPFQFARFLGNFLQGDWGSSLITGRPVHSELADYFPATLELTVAALVVGITLGIGLTLGAEILGYSWLQRLNRTIGAIGLTIPIFWIGLLLIVIGAVWLQVLPGGGRFDFALVPPPRRTGFLVIDSLIAGRFDAFASAARHLLLPTLTLALYPAALVSGVLHARLHDPRIQALLRALRARGLNPVAIWLKHILKLLGAPLVTVVGTNFGALLGGAVLTETVFSWPGVGRFLVEAVLNRDLFAIENGLLLVVLLAVAAVALSDILAYLVNPAGRRGNSVNR